MIKEPDYGGDELMEEEYEDKFEEGFEAGMRQRDKNTKRISVLACLGTFVFGVTTTLVAQKFIKKLGKSKNMKDVKVSSTTGVTFDYDDEPERVEPEQVNPEQAEPEPEQAEPIDNAVVEPDTNHVPSQKRQRKPKLNAQHSDSETSCDITPDTTSDLVQEATAEFAIKSGYKSVEDFEEATEAQKRPRQVKPQYQRNQIKNIKRTEA